MISVSAMDDQDHPNDQDLILIVDEVFEDLFEVFAHLSEDLAGGSAEVVYSSAWISVD